MRDAAPWPIMDHEAVALEYGVIFCSTLSRRLCVSNLIKKDSGKCLLTESCAVLSLNSLLKVDLSLRWSVLGGGRSSMPPLSVSSAPNCRARRTSPSGCGQPPGTLSGRLENTCRAWQSCRSSACREAHVSVEQEGEGRWHLGQMRGGWQRDAACPAVAA